ncbi:MAG: ribonuclease P protein component [Albidovulum sp.]|nr:ribonuclease P protein component [Albidovulum sp.]
MEIAKMRRRIDFTMAARNRRAHSPGLLLQARRRVGLEPDPKITRVGFTCSKKLGPAVARNRAKRRLREVARAQLPLFGKPGWDYVLVGRPNATLSRPYQLLLADLEMALKKIHADSA